MTQTHKLPFLIAAGLVAGLLAGPVAAAEKEPIIGSAVALDGDTLFVAGQKVRLYGIDAPEMSDWPHGALSRSALDRLIESGDEMCTVHGHDRYRRAIATCRVGGRDLALVQLATGQAVTYRVYLFGDKRPRGVDEAQVQGYLAAERQAEQQSLGFWLVSAAATTE